MSRFVPRIIPFYLLLLAAGGTANAQSTFEQKAANPFDNNNDGLPDLGMAPENHDGEKHFAEIVKDFGETSMNDNGLDTGEQAKAFALGKVRDALSQQVNQHVESWLSPWGNASVDVKVDNEDISPAVVEAGLCRYKIMIVISPGASLVLLSRMMGW